MVAIGGNQTKTDNSQYAGERPIIYEQTENAVTVRISGKAFENLRTIADAMNRVGWCDGDNTPTTLLRDFVAGYVLDPLADNPQEVASDIAYGIDTEYRDGTPEDVQRKDELRKAFEAVGM